MNDLLAKITAVVDAVTRRNLRHNKRRELIAAQNKTIEPNEIYPYNNATGAVFRNVENLSMYLYSEMVLEAMMSPYQMAAGTIKDPYHEWNKGASVEQMAVIRAICGFSCIRPNGITATDVKHRLQPFNISSSQVQRVIADGFKLGVLVEIENEHRERYFQFSIETRASAQEAYRVRFSNKKIHDCVQHMHKMYALTSLVHDKENAENEIGLIPHEPTALEEIMNLIESNHIDAVSNHLAPPSDQNEAKVVQMKPHKKS